MVARSDLIRRLTGLLGGLNASVPIPELLTRITEYACDLLRAESAGLAVREDDVMRVVAGVGDRTQLLGTCFPYSGSIAERLVLSGLRSVDTAGSDYPYLAAGLQGRVPERMALAVTDVDGESIGGLYVIRDSPLAADEVAVLELLAVSAGAALRSAERYALAVAERREKEAVIDAMADGLAVLDGDGLVRTWNRALAQLTGIEAVEAVGRPLPFGVPADGETLDQELPSGRWIEIVVAPIAGTQDRVVDVRDISRPKALEAAKDLFLATASHELRTPLTVLRGFGETLLNHWGALDDAKRREIVGTIVARTEGMASLVEQLLLGSRAGIGVDVRVRRFDLASTVRAAAAAIAGSRPDHPLRVDAPEAVWAYGDETTIDGILGQLVENAVKYSTEAGPIDVSVARDGDEAVLRVADTGVGIPVEDLDRVFDRFVRGDAAVGVATGAGLGLWIVRRYLDAQGGRVSAHRRPGGGTVIDVRLPAVART